MIEIDYFKKVVCPVQNKTVQKLAELAGRKEKKIKGRIEVVVVGETEIKSLNAQYRGKKAVTDVLSFAWQENGLKNGSDDLLGQIYLCYPRITRQAKDFGVTAKEEFARMLVHGLLHLVGYDHAQKKEADLMFGLQEQVLMEAKGAKII